ncbi:hypothetical protein DPX16_22806 [Anabarilius grahami]|uniref:Uncharacterized protein n=1 Tax=Anabarilius grahami TaxID=495550 RepID=A0A3N0ZA68_ANAGA|nr:hypothetical protein DPX16_22806 [Anabarilius grahami]
MTITPESPAVMDATPESPAIMDAMPESQAVMDAAPEATKVVPRCLKLASSLEKKAGQKAERGNRGLDAGCPKPEETSPSSEECPVHRTAPLSLLILLSPFSHLVCPYPQVLQLS